MEFDILFAIQEMRTQWLDAVMIFFTSLGDGGMLWIALGLLMLCFKKSRKCGALVLLTLAFCYVVGNLGIKNMVARQRPFQQLPGAVLLLIDQPGEYSFPSGHTMHSFAAATMIFLHHKKSGLVALLVAAVIAFSRMYLFVHFPTDILGGLMIGGLAAVFVFKITEAKLSATRKSIGGQGGKSIDEHV